jgi:hypothetical protein
MKPRTFRRFHPMTGQRRRFRHFGENIFAVIEGAAGVCLGTAQPFRYEERFASLALVTLNTPYTASTATTTTVMLS